MGVGGACRDMKSHQDKSVWQPDRQAWHLQLLYVTAEITGSQDPLPHPPSLSAVCFNSNGFGQTKKDQHELVLAAVAEVTCFSFLWGCRSNRVQWKLTCSFPLEMTNMFDFTGCSAARVAAIRSSPDPSLLRNLQSNLLHIQNHVSGTHATRLWGCCEHHIPAASACHQRIRSLVDIILVRLKQSVYCWGPHLLGQSQEIRETHGWTCCLPLH